jgi:hypothetical protein
MSEEPGQAERWYAKLESIIRRYRAGLVAVTETTLTLDQAIEACRGLHLSAGEAIHYLQPRASR